MTPFCACGEELATVTVSTDDGTVRVGKRCAGLLEMLTKLMGGGKVKRGAVLTIVGGQR